MAVPRSPYPRKGYSAAEIQRDLRGREIEKLRAELDQLRPEYGIRITYTSTLTEEAPVADTEPEARAVLDRLLAERRPDIVSAELIQRKVSEWREIGDARG